MMAIKTGRYIVTSPATSQAFRDALQQTIDNGSLKLREITLQNVETREVHKTSFTLCQTRYRSMSTEFVGTLSDNGLATVVVMTHPDLSDDPARLTLVRRSPL